MYGIIVNLYYTGRNVFLKFLSLASKFFVYLFCGCFICKSAIGHRRTKPKSESTEENESAKDEIKNDLPNDKDVQIQTEKHVAEIKSLMSKLSISEEKGKSLDRIREYFFTSEGSDDEEVDGGEGSSVKLCQLLESRFEGIRESLRISELREKKLSSQVEKLSRLLTKEQEERRNLKEKFLIENEMKVRELEKTTFEKTDELSSMKKKYRRAKKKGKKLKTGLTSKLYMWKAFAGVIVVIALSSYLF